MHLIIGGPAGSGKTTLANYLQRHTGLPFLEGDSLHPPANIAKMAAGHGLNDADRAPWLENIRRWMLAYPASQGLPAHQIHSLITCSALKYSYRQYLAAASCYFLLLEVPEAELRQRLQQRQGHFATTDLLASQLADFEPLRPQESGCMLPATEPVAQLYQRIRKQMPGMQSY